MKKTYTSPRLTKYGTLTNLKNLFGKPTKTVTLEAAPPISAPIPEPVSQAFAP